VALAENQTRQPSAASDLAALQRLRGAAVSLEDVVRLTGAHRQALERLERLERLHPALRQALERGQLSGALAEQVSRLPGHVQAALAEQFRRQGRLRASDVQEARQVRQREAVQRLALEAFEGLDSPGPVPDRENTCRCACSCCRERCQGSVEGRCDE
jgi:hypothetical protein